MARINNDEVIKLRLPKKDKQHIYEMAELEGMSVSKLLREMITFSTQSNKSLFSKFLKKNK